MMNNNASRPFIICCYLTVNQFNVNIKNKNSNIFKLLEYRYDDQDVSLGVLEPWDVFGCTGCIGVSVYRCLRFYT